TESFPGSLLEGGDMLVDFSVEALRRVSPGREVRPARLRRDREPVGHRDAELGHLGEADPLPAEKLATTGGVLAKVEDVAHLRGLYLDVRHGADAAFTTE